MRRNNIGIQTALRRAASIGMLLLLIGAVLPQAYAQRGRMDGPRGPMDKNEFLDVVVPRLTGAVDLTDSQAAQVREIMAEHWEVMNARRQTLQQKPRGERRAARQVMMESMKQQRETTHKRIEALLSEEQVEKFRAYQMEQKDRPRGRRGGPRLGR